MYEYSTCNEGELKPMQIAVITVNNNVRLKVIKHQTKPN